MKGNKLKSIISTTVFLYASTSFSGTTGPVGNTENISIPCEENAWDIGGQALYLQPAYSNDVWINERTITAPSGENSQTFGIPPGYGWGLFLEGSYYFNTGKDLNLNWYYLDHTDKENNILPAGGSRKTTLTTSWTAANFELGQAIELGRGMNRMRIHAGVQYARLHSVRSYSAQFNIPAPLIQSGTGLIVGQNEAGFNGFGPRVGVDLDYKLPNIWMNGFKLYANSAVGLLAGASKANRSITSPFVSGRLRETSNQVLPEIDMKLGLNYSHSLSEGVLNFDAGWMWFNYFSVLNETGTGNGDLAFQGLYFGLKWLGNFA
ncbi:MAG: hypothetical protein K0U37_02155 [Gammaproteobacteria bacterium]|nr:hypothetical protein [Gammaproteobacteria bacterium]